MTKIVFLDVDGVLNRCDEIFVLTFPQPHQQIPLCTEYNTVQAFNAWCRQHDLKIVVSSTWRKIADSSVHFAELTGVDIDLIHDDWRTNNYGDRGDQCMEWLYRHPEVTHHVIFDDNDYNFAEYEREFREGKPHLNFVRTHFQDGLTREDLRDAETYLYGPE